MAEIKSYPNNVNEEIGAEHVMRWHHGRTRGVYGAAGELAVAGRLDPASAGESQRGLRLRQRPGLLGEIEQQLRRLDAEFVQAVGLGFEQVGDTTLAGVLGGGFQRGPGGGEIGHAVPFVRR